MPQTEEEDSPYTCAIQLYDMCSTLLSLSKWRCLRIALAMQNYNYIITLYGGELQRVDIFYVSVRVCLSNVSAANLLRYIEGT